MQKQQLCTLHICPKHIMRHPTRGFVLTGLGHVFDTMSPPPALLQDFGPFCALGDTPLCFFSSGALAHPAVFTMLMAHAAAVCCTLLVENKSCDIVATAEYSSTAAQIKLSTVDHDNPRTVAACITQICAKPTRRPITTTVLSDALKRLTPKRCSCTLL